MDGRHLDQHIINELVKQYPENLRKISLLAAEGRLDSDEYKEAARPMLQAGSPLIGVPVDLIGSYVLFAMLKAIGR